MVQAHNQDQSLNTRYKKKKKVRKIKVMRGDYMTAEALVDVSKTDMMDSMFSKERLHLPESLENS